MYQKVLAVGSSVRDVKVGDTVLLNFSNYIVRKYKENSIKEDMSAQEDEYVYDIPRILIGGKICGKFQDRDVEGVITDFEEFETEQAKKVLR
jgi:predicted ATP-grasp superfamily ATP-dependent carboligase